MNTENTEVEQGKQPAPRWRIEFETGDSLVTEDEGLAQIHRGKGRLVVELPPISRPQ